MKKILLILALVGTTSLVAGEEANKEAIKKSMQSMETSMAFIQRGFLYNHRGRIKKGVTSLRRELKNIDMFMIKNDKDLQFNAKEYAITETKALDLMASRILEDFDKGNKEAVMIEFQQVLNRCVTCHALVRKW
ncbi:MAG: hypothetical protein KAH67_07140 [Flavobacteriaceae bacterium]|nr:hypothetical protein [Flavobacteriaceae bacterium]